jgi:hypothetical protein
MGPILRSARTVLFVDRFFDIREPKYRETLKACLDLLVSAGGHNVRCEIHVCDHPSRPPAEIIEREARRWLQGTLPGISVTLFVWKERRGGADFHARYLLTDVGGMNVESGFSAEGAHQQVQIGLLDFELNQTKLNTFARNSIVFDLVEPVLEIHSDGSVRRV